MRAWILASKLLHFVSLTDRFIMLDPKLLKPLSCMKTKTALQACKLSGLLRNEFPALKRISLSPTDFSLAEKQGEHPGLQAPP